VINVDRVLL